MSLARSKGSFVSNALPAIPRRNWGPDADGRGCCVAGRCAFRCLATPADCLVPVERGEPSQTAARSGRADCSAPPAIAIPQSVVTACLLVFSPCPPPDFVRARQAPSRCAAVQLDRRDGRAVIAGRWRGGWFLCLSCGVVTAGCFGRATRRPGPFGYWSIQRWTFRWTQRIAVAWGRHFGISPR